MIQWEILSEFEANIVVILGNNLKILGRFGGNFCGNFGLNCGNFSFNLIIFCRDFVGKLMQFHWEF